MLCEGAQAYHMCNVVNALATLTEWANQSMNVWRRDCNDG